MLLTPAILLLIAGVAFAAPQNAWKNGKEYTYKIRSRTMAAVNERSNQYSGIVIEASLSIQSNSPEILRAKVSQSRYAQVHTRLNSGWDSKIPQDYLNLQSLPLSEEPFEIKMKNGAVQDVIVDKDVPTWEVNILKSILSQLQIDTQGENVKKLKHNQVHESGKLFSVFKSMEDTVSGKCETVYDISPLPEHVLQNEPELAPKPELREEGDFISIFKTKNYTNCDQRISYNFGISGRNNWEPGSNDNGNYLSRSSVSRVIISGSLDKYTIQSSMTTNKIIHTGDDSEENQQGMVISRMNLTLHEVKDISDPMRAPSKPESTGNLVYNFNNPSESSSKRRPHKINNERVKVQDKKEDSEDFNSSDYSRSDFSDSTSVNDDNKYLQPSPKLQEPPQNPLLPFFIGNRGNSIQKDDKVLAVKSAKALAQQIGNEIQKPDSMPEEQTLEKFTILSRLIRIMNAEQIAEVKRELYEKKQSTNQLNQDDQTQNVRRSAWVAFRDSVAQAGTGPALINIKRWIQDVEIEGTEAARVIDTLSRSARAPTPEYMDTYFDIAMSVQNKKDFVLRDATILSFSDLVRRAMVNRRSAHNRYPVHVFGKLFWKNNHNLLVKYFPRLAEDLKTAVENGDNEKILLYTVAIGKMGHPRMLSVFEPYIEGRKTISPHQRLVMVLSLNKLTEAHPKVARSVLYKIYMNHAEHHEIRTAAVYLLMKTNPPASMLQRMAEFTNYDSSKQVNSAVKSIIESLAQLRDEESDDLSNAARSAQPLLTPQNYGLQYSRADFMSFKNSLTKSGLLFEAYSIGSKDSLVPKAIYVSSNPSSMGIKKEKIEFGATISSPQALLQFIQHKWEQSQNGENYKESEGQRYSPENIAKLLGINGDEPEDLEGMAFINSEYGSGYSSIDKNSLKKLPGQMKQLIKELKEGKSFDETRLDAIEVTISFPTDTGLPFYFTYNVPSIVRLNGKSELNVDADSEMGSELPKSLTASGKVQAVYGMKIQKRLGFITPFENQEYVAGLDKYVQVHAPVRIEIDFNRNKQEARLKIKPNTDKQEYKLLQYQSEPFTSKHDILNLKPVLKDKNTFVLQKDKAASSQIDINDENDKSILQFSWERKDLHYNPMEALRDLTESLTSAYYPVSLKTEYKKYFLKFSPSSDMGVEIQASYDSLKTVSDDDNEDSDTWSPNAKAPYLERSLDAQERKQKLLRESSKNVNSAKADTIDLNVKLTGDIQVSLSATAAFARSNIDSKARALLYVSAKVQEDQGYYFSAGLESKLPHIYSLDYEQTLKANSGCKYDIDFRYGINGGENDRDSHPRIKIHGNFHQTDELKSEIRQSPDAGECKKYQGNKMTESCQKVNNRAKSIDAGDFVITFDHDSHVKNAAMDALDSAQRLFENIETIKNRKLKGEENKMSFGFKVSPNNEKINIDVQTPEAKVEFRNIDLELRDSENKGNHGVERSELNLEYRSVCSLDKTQVETFDSHRYTLQLGQCWHVALTSYPKNNPEQAGQKLKIPKDMHISILTRENENGQKELRVTLGDKEIKLTASAPYKTLAKINGEEVKFSKRQSLIEKKNGEVIFELFKLPDKSVKLVSDKYDIELIYDGDRAQVEVGEEYRDSVRGLCGNNDGEPQNDQQTPKGCLLQKPEEFAVTYALTNEHCSGPARQNAEKAKESQCTFVTPQPGNVINDEEAGRKSVSINKQNGNDRSLHCSHHRTKIMTTEEEICFSTRPVPTCASKCNPKEMISRKIHYHCVQRNSASEKVAQRVRDGANPDLSQKTVSKTETQQVPIGCQP